MKLTKQLISEIEKHSNEINELQYGQVVLIIHKGKLARGQITKNFEPTDIPDSGRSKP